MFKKFLRSGVFIAIFWVNQTQAQYVTGGINHQVEIYKHQKPIGRIGLHLGYSWNHIQLGAKYTNLLTEKRPYRIQEIGIEGRLQAWKASKPFNCFIDISILKQLQANKTGTPMDPLEDPVSLVFYRSNLIHVPIRH